MIYETHTHLNDIKFIDDVETVITNAMDNRVNRILDIACGKNELERSLEITDKYEFIKMAIGVHPVDFQMYSEQLIMEYEELIAKNKNIIAYGEIGLDYHWYPKEQEIQKEIFRKQIEVAQKYDLPIIIHCRDAAEDCLEILQEYNNLKGVIHSFSEDYETAKKFIDLGFHIGIGGPVTFKNGDNQREVVKNIQIDRLLIETDSPYMAPVPVRGSRNEPANLVYVVEKIAEIRNQAVEEVEKQIYENSIKLFKER